MPAAKSRKTTATKFQVIDDSLVIGDLSITFHRTLRVSEHGTNALPPGLGAFPLRAVDPMRQHLPEWIDRRGGVLLPLYLREAMWLSFGASEPVAIQIGTGGRCVVSGEALTSALVRDPQNFVVAPTQPWIDGYKTGDGEVRQFVAVAAGSGQSAEHQLTGSDSVGGVQIQVWHLTPEALERWKANQPSFAVDFDFSTDPYGDPSPLDASVLYCCMSSPVAVGLGGIIEQEVYPDEFEASDWQDEPTARVWVHLVSIADWCTFTGEQAPTTPVDTAAYIDFGLPWFDYYDEEAGDLPATATLANLKSVGQITGEADGAWVHPDSPAVHRIRGRRKRNVSAGDWDWV